MDATVPLLEGFFMRFEQPLYSKRPSAAKRSKKAKKTLEKLAQTNPILKKIINSQAVSMAYKLTKKVKAEPIKFTEPPAYKLGMGKDFYKTREWREVRYKVLVKYGKICQCCGETSGYIHVDHIEPRSLFPLKELDINNLQVLCEACNIGKTNQDTTDWRQQ
jgi:5-methylcytosine-specific restriction endonuclease McrA